MLCTKNYPNRPIFDRVIPKTKRWTFFLRHSVVSVSTEWQSERIDKRPTSTPHPLLEPPLDLVISNGLRTGPEADVKLLPEKHQSSHVALPLIRPPARHQLTLYTLCVDLQLSDAVTSSRVNYLQQVGYSKKSTGWAKLTGPLCYITSNFGNTAQIYAIFCRNQSPFILSTKT